MLVVPNFEFVLLLVKGSRSQNTGRGTGGESIEVKNNGLRLRVHVSECREEGSGFDINPKPSTLNPKP